MRYSRPEALGGGDERESWVVRGTGVFLGPTRGQSVVCGESKGVCVFMESW